MSFIKEYHTATRDELVTVAERLADFIVEHIRQGKAVPVINIYGSAEGGKNLFWDIVVQKVLGQTAIFIPKKSESTQSTNGEADERRLYETWAGTNELTGKDIQIFVCNIRASDDKAHSLDMKALEQGEFESFGDVVLLTNAPNGFFKGNYPVLNIAITTMNTDPQKPNWDRHIAYH